MDGYSKIHKNISDSQTMLIKYPFHVPVLIRCDDKNIHIKKHKFLVPKDITGSQFLTILRIHLNVDPTKAIFVFVDSIIMPHLKLMEEIHTEYLQKHKNKDVFLYLDIFSENTFG